MSEHAERAHARLSPSGAHRWMRCPGSIAASEGKPDDPGEAALEGTRAHEIAERVLKQGLTSATEAFEDAFGPDDKEMAIAVDRYVELVRAEPGDHFYEERVSLEGYVPGGGGTADTIVLSPDGYRLSVMDLKYGYERVDAEENPQLMSYGLGALEDFSFLSDDIEEVRLTIVQPRLDHVSTWSIRADDLRQWGQEVLAPAARAVDAPDAPRVPGKEQCKFCPAKGVCGAFAEFSLEAAREGFEVEDDTRSSRDLTPEEISEALGKLAAVRKWADAIEEEAKRTLELGQAVPGWKLVRGRGSRKWANESEALALLKKKLKVDVAAPRKLISPAQTETAFGGKANVPDKVTDMIESVKGKPTLAPESDKRPALEMNAAAGFEVDDPPAADPPAEVPEPEVEETFGF
ncbi:MAG: DUF2800 domain-containing protein [Pseudomonadota bacterium]